MNLFQQIESALVSNDLREGWATYDKAELLASTILALRPSIVCEVGIWAGRSLVPMALACKKVGKGIVVGIDPWEREASVEGLTGANLEWWATRAPHEYIYQEFMKALKAFDVESVVQIHRKKSDDVEPPLSVGLLHLDGNHSAQAVKDVDRFAPNVILGGFCFMDDIHWIDGGVTQAVENLKTLGFVELFKVDTGAFFQRVKI